MRSEGRRRDESRSRMIPGANHDMPRSMIDEAMTDRIMRVVFRDKLVHQREHAPGYAWANPDDPTNKRCGVIEQVPDGGHRAQASQTGYSVNRGSIGVFRPESRMHRRMHFSILRAGSASMTTDSRAKARFHRHPYAAVCTVCTSLKRKKAEKTPTPKRGA